ncbi:hypothetical protein JMA_40780 (plasmid) [Jeotgalibacillus malaysiensis]|uniref:Calcineurin-like phosphoesterase domain-containing protein n=1 Tax=Jeotgalibacillus malaysiensis TaxID=1508404 RepID=A0A0B5ATH7_9BACL|nr:metallophosphoesterase family protein [Jeotgalibacillus malaysiensis]AJD93396.1 hypothetical protein JMA_40780 [Jeotgalibacillus malaysiensis]
MPNHWFTGDTHFGNQRTLELSRRPFSTVKEMDAEIVRNWNQVVQPDDIVFHIGDFGNYEISHQLNGEIHLILGNYERNDIEKGIVSLDDLTSKFNFKSVDEEQRVSLSFNNELIQLVHEPTNRNMAFFTLFGHIHKLQMVKQNALNVGVDCHQFTPIDLETVLFYKNAIQNHYDKDVFSF